MLAGASLILQRVSGVVAEPALFVRRGTRPGVLFTQQDDDALFLVTLHLERLTALRIPAGSTGA